MRTLITEIDLDLPNYDFGISPTEIASVSEGKRALGLTAKPVAMQTTKKVESVKFEYTLPPHTGVDIYFSQSHPHHFFFFINEKWQHALISRGGLYFSKFVNAPSEIELEEYQKSGIAESVIGTQVDVWGFGHFNEPSWNIALSFRDSSTLTEGRSALQKLIRECIVEILGGDAAAIADTLKSGTPSKDAEKNNKPIKDKRIVDIETKLAAKKEELAKIDARVADATKALIAKSNTIKVEIGKLTKDLENLNKPTQYGK